MSDRTHPKPKQRTRGVRGQALVEYVLIVALVALAIVAILAITGPAIGNVFSNTVYNLLNQNFTPRAPLTDAEFWEYATAVASYVPSPFDVKTNTPIGEDPNKNHPPVAYPDTYNTPLDTPLVVAARGILINDTDPDIGETATLQVTSITFTSPLPEGTLSPLDPNGGFTFTPNTGYQGFVVLSYEIVDARGLTATGIINIGVDVTGPPPNTKTPTPKPSATPVDINLSFPFYDRADNPAFWHTDFNNVVHGPWDIEYFNNPTFTAPAADTGSIFWKPGFQTLDYNWGAGAPLAALPADGFSVVWVANNVPMEDFIYDVQIIANGAATLTIGGWSLSINSDTGLPQTAYGTYDGSGTPVTMRLEFADTTGDASIRLIFNRLADKGTCRWQTAGSSYHSESSAWHDSVGNTNYNVDSTCHLRLRGKIPIPQFRADLSPTRPRLAFWERWELNTQDRLEVGVRDYNSSDAWSWVLVHDSSGTSNLNWRQQSFDLTNFDGKDFRNKSIEIAFRVISIDGNVANGWFIDDISVEDFQQRLYTVGWTDNVDDDLYSPQFFLNECNWRRTTLERNSGTTAWADSPSRMVSGTKIIENYKDNDDCSLVLNGLVDLTDYAASADTPELTFYSRSALNTATDVFTVEWRPENSTNPADWAPFTPLGSSNPWIAKAPTSDTWGQSFINLSARKGERFQLRFRLLADGDGNVADGIYLDDFELRERPVQFVGIPFYEPFNNLARWLVNGNWSLTTGSPAPSYSFPTALTDSPGAGVNYTAPSNTQAELIPQVDLEGTTNPVLSFWSYYDVNDANLLVEISTDDGATWVGTPLWSRPGGEPTQLAWYRHKINLTSYVGQKIKIRFRLQVTSTNVADGWYIDDLRIEEEDTTAVTLSTGTIIEDMNGSTPQDNWYPGGTWAVTTDGGRDNTPAWSDSPTDYVKPSRSVLEYRKIINVSGTDKPTLYFFTKFALGDTADRLYVETSTDNGYTWSATPLWSNPERNNLGWHRVQADLGPLKATPFRLRFRMETMNTNPVGDGWYIDNVTFFDRKFLTAYGLSLTDEFNDLSRWVAEGSWTAVPTMWSGWSYRPEGLIPIPTTYGTVTTSNWVGDYWHIPASNTAVWNAGGVVWPVAAANIAGDNSVAEISFNYEADTATRPFSPGITAWQVTGTNNYEYYLMRWQRRYSATTPGLYRFRLTFAGGARVYVNGSLVNPNMSLERPFKATTGANSNPFIKNSLLRTYFYETNLTGTFDIRVEYFHTTFADSGPGRIEFAFAEQSTVARTSTGSLTTDTYPHLNRVSLILNGLMTISAGKVANVGYQERWSLTDDDYAKVYYSYDEGFTWTEMTALRRSNNNPQGGGWVGGSLQDWVNTSFVLTDPITGGTHTTERKVMIKFELDSRLNTAVDEGWLLDNFTFVLGEVITNQAPVSATVNISTTADVTKSGNIPTVVDTPGDTHTFVVTTQPLRGTVNVIGNAMEYVPPTSEDFWTGTTTFLFSVTDAGGLTTVNQVGYITVEPSFWMGVNIGNSTSSNSAYAGPVTIDGNNWVGYNTSDSGSSNTSTGNVDSATLNPAAIDSDFESMIENFRYMNDTTSGNVQIKNANSAGIYTYYLYVVQRDTNAITYDVLLEFDTRNRLINNISLPPTAGEWRKLGPYTVQEEGYGTTLALLFRGGQAAVSGIEVWRGGQYQDWTYGDIGGNNVCYKGSQTGGGDNVSITAGGADIWGTADEFRYGYRYEMGSIRMTAQVMWPSSPPDGWSKAGLMIRESDAVGARYGFLALTRDNGITFQQRTSTDGSAVSTYTGGSVPTGTPYWIRLEYYHTAFGGYPNDTMRAYTSSDGVTWTQYDTNRTVNVSNSYLIGLAVTSHNDCSAATAQFSNVSVEQIGNRIN